MSPEDGAGRRIKKNNPLKLPGTADTQLEAHFPAELQTLLWDVWREFYLPISQLSGILWINLGMVPRL